MGYFTVEPGGSVRWLSTGEANLPTASVGNLLTSSSEPLIITTKTSLDRLKFIATSGTVSVNSMYGSG